jgi:2-dehydropantoate 2-reductase
MKILVIGAGAVGSFLGGRLAQAGNEVTLVVRPTAAPLITSDGLFITEGRGRVQVHLRAVTSLRQAFLDGQTYDALLICVKSYDTDTVIHEMAAFCPQPPTIITMQNGIGVEESFIAEFGADGVVAGSITVPLSMGASNSVLVEVEGKRGLGLAPVPDGPSPRPWAEMFRRANITTILARNHESLKWSKVLLNISGNATSAIVNRHPSVIYRYGPTYDLELDMLREALAVANKAGIKLIDLPGPSLNTLVRAVKWLPRSMVQPVLLRIVSAGRGDKMPSFQIDLASGKGKNEVAYHNLAIAERASLEGMAAPINEALGTILMRLTRKELDWQRYNGKPDQLVADVRRFQERSVPPAAE